MYQLNQGSQKQQSHQNSLGQKQFQHQKALKQKSLFMNEQNDQISRQESLMDKQMKIAIDQAQQQIVKKDKVQKLLQRAKQKFKLDKQDIQVKFDNRFYKEVRSIKTFVDANKQLKMLNVFNDERIMKYVDYLRLNKQVILNDREQDQIKFNISNQYVRQLASEQNEELFPTKKQMEKDGYLTLNLIQDSQNQDIEKNATYYQQALNSDNILTKTQTLLKNLNYESKNQQDSKIDKFIDDNFNQKQMNNQASQDQFYSIQNRKMIQKEFAKDRLKIDQNKQSQTEQQQKIDKVSIKELIEQYGIDVHSTELQMNKVHLKYAENSAKLIKSIHQNSIVRFHTCPDEIITTKQQRRLNTNSKELNINSQELLKISNATNLPSLTAVAQKKRNTLRQFQTNKIRNSLQLGSNISNFISKIEVTEKQFTTDRFDDNINIQKLDNDICMMQRKHELLKISSMGYNSYDPDIDLRRNINSLQIQIAKRVRKNKILQYF